MIDPFYHYSFDDFNVSLNSRSLSDGNYTIVSSFSTNYNFDLFYSQSFEIQNYHPPLLTLLSPSNGDFLKGEVIIEWFVQDDNYFEVDLFFYPTSSSQPYLIATDLRNSSLVWDTAKVTDTLHGKIVIMARNNLYSTVKEIKVVVDNTPPVILEISHPEGKVNESYYYIESKEEEIEMRWEWEISDMIGINYTSIFLNNALVKESYKSSLLFHFNFSNSNQRTEKIIYNFLINSSDLVNNKNIKIIKIEILWVMDTSTGVNTFFLPFIFSMLTIIFIITKLAPSIKKKLSS
ncbi:MAG: hypothetical protein ACTSYA_03225 [Candidatus Kariarchaeaceae archaeon]